jgi:hypothetical protein
MHACCESFHVVGAYWALKRRKQLYAGWLPRSRHLMLGLRHATSCLFPSRVSATWASLRVVRGAIRSLQASGVIFCWRGELALLMLMFTYVAMPGQVLVI